MIPSVCANCGHGVKMMSDEGVIGVICAALPIDLWKRPGDICGSFVMDENPYVTQDDPEQPVELAEEQEDEPAEDEDEA